MIEKLLYHAIKKFSPKAIAICSLAPLGAYRKGGNAQVLKFNRLVSALAKNLSDQEELTAYVLDANKDMAAKGFLAADELHPTIDGVKCLVNLHRGFLAELHMPHSTSEDIEMREYVAPVLQSGTNNKRLVEDIVNDTLNNLSHFKSGQNYVTRPPIAH